MKKRDIVLRVNGDITVLDIWPNETLREVLRDRLELTGLKAGCDDGSCGACTVLLDGRPVRSCLLLAAEVEHRKIVTIEGLAEEGRLHPVQQAFVDHHAIQCGFCSPGMILTATALLEQRVGELSRETIREAISGNLCRCTGYAKIVDAIAVLAAEPEPEQEGKP